jgi:hypothetical protein
MQSVSVVSSNRPNKKSRALTGSGKSSKTVQKDSNSQSESKCPSGACSTTWKPLAGLEHSHKSE